MPIKIKINEEANESYEDYILYEILCDYCDEEYTIKYMMNFLQVIPRNTRVNVVFNVVILIT